ncbi:MAG TPA: hypothetical protein ENI78_01580 [Euryarchaeota archaeon]|nr:hypothetical protein [Euryarchaeota archaeon]
MIILVATNIKVKTSIEMARLCFFSNTMEFFFHSEICNFHSLISDKELDIKEDKSLVRRLFGRLQNSTISKAEKIRQVV